MYPDPDNVIMKKVAARKSVDFDVLRSVNKKTEAPREMIVVRREPKEE